MNNFLKFIGRGSAFNPKMGNTSAFFYTGNGTTFNLIDCGCTVFERILELELINTNVKKVNVFITHTHDDHIGSLASLIEYCYYIKKVHVNLYDFNLALSGLPSILLSMDVNHRMYRLNPDIKVDNTHLQLDDNITIVGFSVDHIPTIKSTAFEITNGKSIIVYTGDHNDARINDDYFTLYGYNYIFTDCSVYDYNGNPHVSLSQLCRRFAKHQRTKVYCMHIESEASIEEIKAQGFNVVETYTKKENE